MAAADIYVRNAIAMTFSKAFGQPLMLSRQRWIAAVLGAVGAGSAAVLEVIATVGVASSGTFLPYALMLALPVGALAGVLCLSVGRLIQRLLRRRAVNLRISAIGAGVSVLVLGTAITAAVVFGLIPQLGPFAWPPILASTIGAVGIYQQLILPQADGRQASSRD